MKAILYIIAIVSILAGAWLSYDSMQKFEQLKTDRIAKDEGNVRRKAQIVKQTKESKEMEGQRDLAEARFVEAEEGLANTNGNLATTKKTAAKWNSDIAGQKERLDELETLIESIKKAFKNLDPNIELTQVPALVQQLEDDLKSANKKLEELQELASAAEGRVATNNSQIQDLDRRQAKRAERIKSNSAEGRVTATNHDWGFVTLEVPSNMTVASGEVLTIKRGMANIGHLVVQGVEGKRIIADIDYKSMTAGLVVQPGDNVIRTKPLTN